MMSNSVSAQNLLALWTLNALRERARAALFEYMHFVRVLENITFFSLFTKFVISIVTVTSNNHPLLIGDMRSSTKQSLAVGVSCL